MNIPEYIKNVVEQKRKTAFNESDQLSLGEMLLKLEPILERKDKIIEKYGTEPTVIYDFGKLFPTKIDSWRGSYSELALDYKDIDNEDIQPMTITEFVKMLKSAIGFTYIGYKGGEFTMNKNTPVWVSNYGHSSETAIINIIDNEFNIILITALRGY